MSDDKPSIQNRVDALKKELLDRYGLDHHIERPGALWPGHNPLAKLPTLDQIEPVMSDEFSLIDVVTAPMDNTTALVRCGASEVKIVNLAPPQCAHKTRHSFKSYNKHDTHTLQCGNPSGHDGAHQWKDEVTGRSVIWFNDGPPPEIDYSTRFRFFKDH